MQYHILQRRLTTLSRFGLKQVRTFSALHDREYDNIQKTLQRSRELLDDQQNRGLWKDDLRPSERTKEDEAIVKEMLQEQIQKNKWIHFQNEQMGTRWTGDSERNTLEGLHEHSPIEELRKEGTMELNKIHGMPHIDDAAFHKPPSTYYQPHSPLPAFRNHEALFNVDPRNPAHVPASQEIETETKSLLHVHLKPEKLPQIRDGVAYSPNFDFDLWGEDFYRPRYIQHPHDYGNRWVIPKSSKPMMRRKTLSMRQPLRQGNFAPEWDKLIEFRYKSTVTRDRWKPWKKPVFRVMKIVGNGRGCAGFGIGVATSYDEANQRANYEASHNMLYIPRYRNRTLAHPVEGKHNRVTVRFEPRPVGSGGTGPYLLRAVACAFGIHDYNARFVVRRRSHRTRLVAIFRAFQNATNAQQLCEDRGQRLVQAFPEQDHISYHLPRGFAHDNRVHAVQILRKHLDKYESAYEDKFLDRAEILERQMPEWCKQPSNFWEGQDPDTIDFKWGHEKFSAKMKECTPKGVNARNLPHVRWQRLSSNERDRDREEKIAQMLEVQRIDNREDSKIAHEIRQNEYKEAKEIMDGM